MTEFPHNEYGKISSIENNYLQNCGTYDFDSQDNLNLPFEYFNQNIIPLLNKHPFPLFIYKTDSCNLNELEKQEFESKFN